MAIVSEGGKISRTGKSAKSKLALVEASKPGKKVKPAAKARPAKEPAAADAPKACDLCGATGVPLSYSNGNAACEVCTKAAQADAGLAKVDERKARRPKAGKAKDEAAPPTASEVIPRSLADLAQNYAKQMVAEDKSPATRAGYENDLGLAVRELGADTLVSDLTQAKVGEYFASDVVNLLRSGGPKSNLSVLKTQRVLRLALDHAVELGWIENAPVPAAAKS